MRVEYAIQEYSGKNYKNADTMAKALANDKNWWGLGPVTRYVEDAVYPKTRTATYSEALESFKEREDHYEKYGRRFRLVSRTISDWEVVA